MMRIISVSAITVLSLALASCGGAETRTTPNPAHFIETINAQAFFKGNLHTHTNESDGNVSPLAVITWFKKHGYNFLSLTDHDKLVINHSQDQKDFVTLNGVELTGLASEKRPVHVNAICGKKTLVGVRAEKSVPETANAMIVDSNKDGAISILNHPNFGWAFSADDLLATDGFEFLEIASGHFLINENGNGQHAGEEELWDQYMTRKHRVFGVAVDDSHNYTKFADNEANPGRAWIQAWAPELSQDAICLALRQGHFYSARGTKINALVVTPRTIELSVESWQPSTDHVDFIGKGGELLDRVTTLPARYTLRGGEGYVRAHVRQDKKREAWTQPYFIKNE